MDGFAQTRAPDDLFDDDFTPVEQPAPVPIQEAIPPPQQTASRPRQSQARRGQHNEAPSGRGRGGRGGRREPPPSAAETPTKTPTEGDVTTPVDETPKEEVRPSAVRGDRSGTGGVKKPKLTESELSERLASIKLKNVAREEAHRRAEADEASFQQREKLELAKRKEERQNRQVMEGERERNRMRKLKAVGGREWDAEKKEEDLVDRKGSQFRRGAYGGVVGGVAGTRDEQGGLDGEEGGFDRGYNSRGRGDRGRGRGRGRGGRGGGGGSLPMPSRHQHDVTAEADFPALPPTTTAPATTNTIPPASSEPPVSSPNPPIEAVTTTLPTSPLPSTVTPEPKESSSVDSPRASTPIAASEPVPAEVPTTSTAETTSSVDPKPEIPVLSPMGDGENKDWADEMEVKSPGAAEAGATAAQT